MNPKKYILFCVYCPQQENKFSFHKNFKEKKRKNKMEINTNLDKKSKLSASPTPNFVILLGDSVLDNFYWLKDKKECFSKVLTDYITFYELKRKEILEDPTRSIFQVINLAMDETSTFNFFDRDPHEQPFFRYSQEKKKFYLHGVRKIKIATTRSIPLTRIQVSFSLNISLIQMVIIDH